MRAHLARFALASSLCASLLCPWAGADTDAPFTWEVKGPKATHYLVGSVHLLPQSENVLPKGLEDVYDSAEGLMFETDIGALEQQQVQIPFLQAAHTEKGLKSLISPPLHAKLVRRLRKLGVDTGVCEPFKPWFCSLALEILTYRDAGFSGEDGIDEKFYKSAISDGKSVRWFESPAEHLGLFADMSDAMSLRLLESALDDTATQLDEPKQVYRTWRKDDFAVIESVTAQLKTAYPDLYERLLAERNRHWMPKLKQALDGAEVQLIVVGAAHLAGPDGLIARLGQSGYRLQRYITLPGEQIQARRSLPDLIRVRATAPR